LVKLWVYCDERYPDYGVTTDKSFSGVEIELTENEYAQGKKAETDYAAWQKLLTKKREGAFAKDHNE
jgi:hypothetical protein